MERDKNFKVCPSCGFIWKDQETFLNDEKIQLVGYQVDFEELRLGLFLFDHSCGTTFSVKAEKFFDLYSGPIFEKRLTASVQCPGYCLHRDQMCSCKGECECSFVREILQIIQGRKK